MMIIKGRLDFWSALLMRLSFFLPSCCLGLFFVFVFVFNAASYFTSSQFSPTLWFHTASLDCELQPHTSPFFYTPGAILAGLLPKSMLKVWGPVSVIPVFERKRQRVMSSRPSWASEILLGKDILSWERIPVPLRRSGLKEVPEQASVGSWGSHLLGTSERRV